MDMRVILRPCVHTRTSPSLLQLGIIAARAVRRLAYWQGTVEKKGAAPRKNAQFGEPNNRTATIAISPSGQQDRGESANAGRVGAQVPFLTRGIASVGGIRASVSPIVLGQIRSLSPSLFYDLPCARHR